MNNVFANKQKKSQYYKSLYDKIIQKAAKKLQKRACTAGYIC